MNLSPEIEQPNIAANQSKCFSRTETGFDELFFAALNRSVRAEKFPILQVASGTTLAGAQGLGFGQTTSSKILHER